MPEGEISLSRPDITAQDERLVLEALRSGRLSIGPMQEEFERLVASAAGCSHGIAVSSGTAGLHLAMLALGVGEGDEVITTPFSFIASANCILYVGARPVFCDICPQTLNMDPAKVEAAITPRTKAIIAVEAFGNPAYMDAYANIAAKHEIPLIEDSCEALGTVCNGRRCGSYGRAGVFGFYPNKQITTGEGGMIVTDDDHLADMCRSLRNQGRPARMSGSLGNWLRHERLGFNYRLSELNCALGVSQMRRLDELIERRREIARAYIDRLRSSSEIMLPTIEEGCELSWFVFVVRLSTEYSQRERDRILLGLRNHDVGCADYFPCIHLQPPYEALGFEAGSFPIAESVSHRTIALPFHTRLSERDIDLVCQTLELMNSREQLSRD